jgi:anhydro-N-acetylmuramic acid kinase
MPSTFYLYIMLYRTIGLMSGSSLDGLDIAFAEIHENGGVWGAEILAADCYPYPPEWMDRLKNATSLNALHYQLLHVDYGHYVGEQVNRFIEENGLHYRVALISSHGHTTFHLPGRRMTGQLGDGAAIAAVTGLPVVSDLRAMDVAFGGQGAPIVPIGEKLLFRNHSLFLNLGGIANISFNTPGSYIAFDVCPANRVLNMLAALAGKEYDAGGQMASEGSIHEELLQKLNALPYYAQPYPKSLANDFGTDEVFPIIQSFSLSVPDALRTYVEHIVQQIGRQIRDNRSAITDNRSATTDNRQPTTDDRQPATEPETTNQKPETAHLLVTGGGALNTFLVGRLQEELEPLGVEVSIPDEKLVQYKEALVMALIGVLRWRQEYNVLSSVTGARRDSIGGALWIGQEA